MNIINNTSVELLVEYWVVNGSVNSYISTSVKPGDKLYENKCTTQEWNIVVDGYVKIFTVYNKPTSYKNLYYTTYYNGNKFDGKYIHAKTVNMANTFIITENRNKKLA